MLEILDQAVELVRRLKPYIQQIAKGDAELARQLRDASKSVALNLAEGSGCYDGRKRNHYRIALGSARETHISLRLAEVEELIERLDPETADLLDHVTRVTSKLAR